jgi:hypothetical protein
VKRNEPIKPVVSGWLVKAPKGKVSLHLTVEGIRPIPTADPQVFWLADCDRMMDCHIKVGDITVKPHLTLRLECRIKTLTALRLAKQRQIEYAVEHSQWLSTE